MTTDKLYSADEVAEACEISRQTLWRWERDGKIPEATRAPAGPLRRGWPLEDVAHVMRRARHEENKRNDPDYNAELRQAVKQDLELQAVIKAHRAADRPVYAGVTAALKIEREACEPGTSNTELLKRIIRRLSAAYLENAPDGSDLL